MKSSLFLMTLGKVKGLGRKTLHDISLNEIKNAENINDIYESMLKLRNKYKRIKNVSKEELNVFYEESLKVLEKNDKLNIVTIEQCSKYYPKNFLKLEDRPLYFFAKGNIEALNMEGIALVGTRNISKKGKIIGERFGEFLAEKGLTVISGLAEGCDTAGHTGCLKANGITIAIVATPLNKVYPKTNENLAKEIIKKNGCIISEYPLGYHVGKNNFIERDRLQCGLANGVIVIEAGKKSGTMHSVRGAIKLGKPVGCFNYDENHYLNNVDSLGNKMLIDSNEADALHYEDSIINFLKKCTNRKNIISNKDKQMSLLI